MHVAGYCTFMNQKLGSTEHLYQKQGETVNIGQYADAREAAKAVDVTMVFLVRLDDAYTSNAPHIAALLLRNPSTTQSVCQGGIVNLGGFLLL